MGKRRTPGQVIAKLRQAEAEMFKGATVGQVCRRPGVGEPTFHRRRTSTAA